MKLSKSTKAISLGLILAPTCWILYRWTAVQITHDEAWSFRMAYDLLWRHLAGTANNHLLNTFFLIIETHTLGTDLWAIRIHTILSFLCIAALFVSWSSKLKNSWLIVLLFALILYNTYIMDFFSLARGYGMGMFFGLWAMYEIVYAKKFTYRKRLHIYFILILASLSVYTELYFLMGFLIYEFIFVAYPTFHSKKAIRKYLSAVWIPFLFIVLASIHLRFIQICGDLEQGLTNGFLEDTIGVFFHRAFLPFISIGTGTLIGVLLIGTLVFFVLRNLKNKETPAWRASMIVIILMCLSISFFYILDTPFPYGRTALYFITLLLCSIVLVIDHYTPFNRSTKILQYIMVLMVLVSHISYAVIIKNPRTTQEWWGGQGVEDAIQDIARTETRNLDSLNTLLYHWHAGDYINYYKSLPKKYQTIPNLGVLHQDYTDSIVRGAQNIHPDSFDYVWQVTYDTFIANRITKRLFDTLAYYPDMKTAVLRRK